MDEMSTKSRANEIFAEIMATHGLTIEAVATVTGYSTAHVGRWKLGEAVIPADAWGAIWRLTGDPRWFNAHQIPIMAMALPAERPRPTPPPGDPAALIPRLITAQEEACSCLRYLHAIVRDSRIDAKDDVAIGQFIRHRRQVCDLFERVEQALVAARAAEEKP